MSFISIYKKQIEYNGKKIYTAPSRIDIAHIFNDRVIILYNGNQLFPEKNILPRDIPVVSPEHLDLVNRNLLMIDFNGNVLWRADNQGPYYNPWGVVGTDIHTGEWHAGTQDGYKYELNPETGEMRNGMQMR